MPNDSIIIYLKKAFSLFTSHCSYRKQFQEERTLFNKAYKLSTSLEEQCVIPKYNSQLMFNKPITQVGVGGILWRYIT